MNDTLQHTSVRIPQVTVARIAQLKELYGTSTSVVLSMAIDRMWLAELHNTDCHADRNPVDAPTWHTFNEQ